MDKNQYDMIFFFFLMQAANLKKNIRIVFGSNLILFKTLGYYNLWIMHVKNKISNQRHDYKT